MLFSSAETAPSEEEHLDPGAQAAKGSTESQGLREKEEHSQRQSKYRGFTITDQLKCCQA